MLRCRLWEISLATTDTASREIQPSTSLMISP